MRLGIFYPPTCVGLRYGRPWKGPQRFSRRSNQETGIGSPRTLLPLSAGRLSQIPRTSWFNQNRCRNINLLCIAYANRPGLSSRLTPGRKSLPGKPWVYGGRGFHPPFRYSCLHPLFLILHGQSPSRFNAIKNAPLPRHVPGHDTQSFGITLIANHFRRGISR